MSYSGMDKLCREEVWAVVGEHPDDGYPTVFSRWFTEQEAIDEVRDRIKRLPGFKCGVAKKIIWWGCDDDGQKCYFDIPTMREVPVSPPSLESIKAKLSDAELKVLGIKR